MQRHVDAALFALFLNLAVFCCHVGGKAPAGASRLALTLNGSETEEQLAQINSVDAVVALLDIQVGVLSDSMCVVLVS